MQIHIGHFYFIKDNFFEDIHDSELMQNKENGTFLIQNMFPVTEKYIENQYVKNNVAVTLSYQLQQEVISKANKVLSLYNHGMKKIIFPNIDKILQELLK